MKVVIIAKTKQENGIRVDGLTFNGRFHHLTPTNTPSNYTIGDVWEVEATDNDVTPRRKMPPISDVAAFIQQHCPPHEGSLDTLPQAPNSFHPVFWITDQPLVRG